MKLTVWINAFIPEHVPGYTKKIPKGKHAGKTAVPLPGLALLNPINLVKDLFNWWDTGYLTDQRTFSIQQTASVRMRSLMVVDLAAPTPRMCHWVHESTGTTEVDMKTGEQLGFDFADMSDCWFRQIEATPKQPTPMPGFSRFPAPRYPTQPQSSNVAGNGEPSKGPTIIKVHGEAGDPLVSAAADIDYEGVFRIYLDPGKGCTVTFEGLIDAFPAFESYAVISGGKVQTIFTAPPPEGNTVTNLPGSANRKISGQATFRF